MQLTDLRIFNKCFSYLNWHGYSTPSIYESKMAMAIISVMVVQKKLNYDLLKSIELILNESDKE